MISGVAQEQISGLLVVVVLEDKDYDPCFERCMFILVWCQNLGGYRGRTRLAGSRWFKIGSGSWLGRKEGSPRCL